MNIFTDNEVNTGRQIEFDLAKAFAIILMIWVHVYDQLSTTFEPSVSYYSAYWRSAIYDAVTFMFCMGIGMIYTRSNTPKGYAKRGVSLLLTGLLLEFCRDVVPGMSHYWITGEEASLSCQAYVLGVDILQFAGLAFLLMALLRRLRLNYGAIFGISVLMSVAAWPLESVQTGCYAFDQFLGYFWGTETESYFPLLSWFIFVAAGCLFGRMYRHLRDKRALHRICLPIGLAVTAAYIYICACTDQGVFLMFSDERWFAHRMLPDALMCLVCNVGLISLMYYLGRIIPAKVAPVITYPSKHINKYYCVSWVLIMIATYYANPELDSDLPTIIAWLICTALTTGIVVLYNNKLKKPCQIVFGRHYAFWMTLVVIAVVAAFVCGYIACDGNYPNFLNDYLAE